MNPDRVVICESYGSQCLRLWRVPVCISPSVSLQFTGIHQTEISVLAIPVSASVTGSQVSIHPSFFPGT